MKQDIGEIEREGITYRVGSACHGAMRQMKSDKVGWHGATLLHCYNKAKGNVWTHPPIAERKNRPYSNEGLRTVYQKTAEERHGGVEARKT